MPNCKPSSSLGIAHDYGNTSCIFPSYPTVSLLYSWYNHNHYYIIIIIIVIIVTIIHISITILILNGRSRATWQVPGHLQLLALIGQLRRHRSAARAASPEEPTGGCRWGGREPGPQEKLGGKLEAKKRRKVLYINICLRIHGGICITIYIHIYTYVHTYIHTMHCVALHCIALHCITQTYTTLPCLTLPSIHYITFTFTFTFPLQYTIYTIYINTYLPTDIQTYRHTDIHTHRDRHTDIQTYISHIGKISAFRVGGSPTDQLVNVSGKSVEPSNDHHLRLA